MLSDNIGRLHDQLLCDVHRGVSLGNGFAEALIYVLADWQVEASTLEAKLAPAPATETHFQRTLRLVTTEGGGNERG